MRGLGNPLTMRDPRKIMSLVFGFRTMNTEDSRHFNALTAVESNPSLTQRILAAQLGLGLGTTNKLVQSLVKRKWVKSSHKNGRTRYHLTSTGLAEKLRLLKLRRKQAFDYYLEICERISTSLEKLSKDQKRLVFYGAGDVAHIVYTQVAHSRFELVGVVDDEKVGQEFFGYEIAHPPALKNGILNTVPFDVIIVASYNHADDIGERLRRMNFPPSQVLSLFE